MELSLKRKYQTMPGGEGEERLWRISIYIRRRGEALNGLSRVHRHGCWHHGHHWIRPFLSISRTRKVKNLRLRLQTRKGLMLPNLRTLKHLFKTFSLSLGGGCRTHPRPLNALSSSGDLLCRASCAPSVHPETMRLTGHDWTSSREHKSELAPRPSLTLIHRSILRLRV